MKKKVLIVIAAVIVLVLIIVGVTLSNKNKPGTDVTAEEQGMVSGSDENVSASSIAAENSDGEHSGSDRERNSSETENEESGEAETVTESESTIQQPEAEEEIFEPISGEEEEIVVTPDTAWTEWDSFLALSPEEQDEFMKSFESVEAFTEWMKTAQQEWAEAHPYEEIGSGGIIVIGD